MPPSLLGGIHSVLWGFNTAFPRITRQLNRNAADLTFLVNQFSRHREFFTAFGNGCIMFILWCWKSFVKCKKKKIIQFIYFFITFITEKNGKKDKMGICTMSQFQNNKSKLMMEKQTHKKHILKKKKVSTLKILLSNKTGLNGSFSQLQHLITCS